MRHGIAQVSFPPQAVVAAPRSGVRLGMGADGERQVRLFRLRGTSLAIVATVLPAQLLAVRVAAGGTPVQILTARPGLWQSVRFTERLTQILAPDEPYRPPDGPSLLIDDRPAQVRTQIDAVPWQCRVDLRTEWNRRDVSSLAYADLTLLGAVSAEIAQAVASTYRVPAQHTSGLVQLEPGVVGLARRGHFEYVRLDPTAAEAMLMSTGQPTGQRATNSPTWR